MAPLVGSLRPTTFDGHDIASSPYVASFVGERGGLETVGSYRSQPVEVDITGGFPLDVRGQPLARDIQLRVGIVDGSYTLANVLQLQRWFDPDPHRGTVELVVIDSDNNESIFVCRCVGFQPVGTGNLANWMVSLRAADGRRKDVDSDSDSQDVDAGTPGSETWALTDKGSTPAPLAITLTASAAKDPGDSWPNRRRIAFANRAAEALGDRDVYAVKLCNLTDEGLSQISSSWDHIRVLINSEYVDRWISDNDDLWVNYRWQPRKVATLAANINDSVDSLSVSNADGFARDVWPDSQGFFFLDDEAIFYSAERTTTELSGLIRGALGTTAASHTAGATLYWIEFPHIDILYGYMAATDPQPPDDRKPLLDLEDSENDSHVYGADGLTARNTRRSMQFAMRSSDSGVGAQHTQQYDDSGVQTWENNLPVAGKPALNEASRLFPVPLAGPVEMDIEVGLPMLLRGFVEDSEGYETRLIDEPYTPTPLTAESFSLPTNVRKLRLVGSVGVVVGMLDQGLAANWNAQSGTSDDEVIASYQDTAVRFVLDQDTKATGLIVSVSKAMGATGDLVLYIMEDDGGRPKVDNPSAGVIHPAIVGSTIIHEADIDTGTTPVQQFLTFLAPFNLPAGAYWLSFNRPAGVGSGLFYTGYDAGGFHTYVGGSVQLAASITFAIVSDETEPQDDAPLDGGETITVANAVFPLDSTQAPKIVVGAEEDFYLLEATLSNAAGDYVSLRYAMALDVDLTVDTGTRRIIEGEFDTDVAFVHVASSDAWPQAAPVDEVLTWTEDGALITVATERTAEYL